jgi:glycosyltransferase involved in cell wall biosynthesis
LDHGINSDKVRETFMSVDVDFFAQKATKVKEQAMLVGHRFLFVGQLVKRKNASNVIEAFSRINSETDSLRIVGSGREKKDLVDLARKSDSRSQIEFIEHLSPEELVKIYLNSNTLVMPSTQEVWGLVANEALASGMHVVVSELSGVAPNIDGMKGVYISKTDVTSIQVAMQLSKNEWTGRISNPEILNHGVREMSIDLTNAIRELI